MNNSIFSLQKRLLAVYVLVTFIFVALAIRIGYIQLFKSKWLQAKAVDQWTRDLPLQAKRGEIIDTNGVILATSTTSYDVYVRPSMVENKTEVASMLSAVLNISFESIYEKIQKINLSEVLIKMQIDESSASKIKESNLKGILLSENNRRYYPYGDLATQVIGMTSIDNIGQSGLELVYDKYLTGVDGYALTESDVKGVKIENSLNKYIPSIAGCDINLTIDVNVQISLEKALEKLMGEQKPKSATGIVMKVKTGEIVGMSTKPSFDLNSPPRDNVDYLLQSLRNVSIVDVYEPGSTFKVLTMATALDLGVAKLENTFYCPGYIMVDGEKIKCWKHIGHGSQNLTDGLCNSCNNVFCELALRIGKDRLYESFTRYGLGNTLDVDFLGEASGIIMNKESAKTVDYARMGFGQAIAVTPIQLISAICSVINGGNLMQPYFVQSIKDATGKIIYENSPKVLRKTVSNETSEKIKVMFEEVVKNYSAIESFIPGFRVSGKTGTTQKYDESGKISGEYIASFCGAFPSDNPEYAILILADEPSMGNYYGSIVATPYAKLVFQDIISYKQILPTENFEEDLKKIEKNILMPNLVGKSLTEAISILLNLNLQYEITGEGLTVLSQTPPPETYVFERAVVILST